jgi:hypothetical protein
MTFEVAEILVKQKRQARVKLQMEMQSGSFSWFLSSLTRGVSRLARAKKLHWLQTSPVSWLSGDEVCRCGVK